MIDFNITQDDINDVFSYFEAIEKKPKKKTSKERLDSIKTILNKETNKRGRKSASYSVIKTLTEKQMNEIAIYVGIALVNMKINPKWTVDEVLTILNNKSFIDKELIPLLSNDYLKDKDLSQQELKSMAIKIQENIVKNEKDTIDNIRNLMSAKKRDANSILVHQLNRQQLTSVRNAIIKTIKILSETTDDFDIKDILNHNPGDDSNEFTYAFFNTLLGNTSYKKSTTISLLAEINLVLKSLNKIKDKGEVTSDSGQKKLNSWIADLNKSKNIFDKLSTKTIIWPQASKPIKSIDDIKKYFQQLELEREKVQKVINQYKKRKAPETTIPTGDDKVDAEMQTSQWNDEKVNALINKTAKEMAIEKQYVGVEPQYLIKDTDAKAQELIDNNEGLNDYIDIDHPDVIGELSSRLAARIQSRKATVGRPTKYSRG